MMKRIISTICVSFVLAHVCFSQNAVEDFKKLNQVYKDNAEMSMKVIYNLYKDFNSEEVVETESCDYYKKADQFYMEYLGYITLQNEKYLLAVNKDDKNIIVSEVEKQSEHSLMNIPLEEALDLCDNIEFSKENNFIKYSLAFGDKLSIEYSKIDVFINESNFFIEKMIVYYNYTIKFDSPYDVDLASAPRLEVLFQNINTNPDFTQEIFSENQFITTAQNSIKVNSNYSAYTLTNLINE